MKRYLIHTSVQGAEGFQTWYVDATTEEEAMDKYRNGDSDIYVSEVDVTSLGDPEIEGTTTLDDFGDFGPTPQRQWVGLTYPDREALRYQFADWNYPASLVSAIEAKLKEKNI